MKRLIALGLCLSACTASPTADLAIVNGQVFVGDNSKARSLTIAIKDGDIIYVGDRKVRAQRTIDANGLYVVPGFIDPHTHAGSDLSNLKAARRQNLNYQTQGVTTVIIGSDGGGRPDIAAQMKTLNGLGIGTNTALFVGHNAVRRAVMGDDDRTPTEDELTEMNALIAQAMKDGALGLSSGLYYAPGSFSKTDEVITLAKTAAQHGGIYDTHVRNESDFDVGIKEALTISEAADIPLHIAHIKGLGVDSWGKAQKVINTINTKRASGRKITADQYPWAASGTRISNALIPRWVKAGGQDAYDARLRDSALIERIKSETQENLRRRGGPGSLLITSGKPDWIGKTLGDVANTAGLDPVDMAIEIARNGDARVASFNMNEDDIKAFMVQSWVMTGSDGTNGHPRKYASYPKKYTDYVIKDGIMPVETFFYRSSGLVADTFGLCGRGYIRTGYAADIAIINPKTFKANADYFNAKALSDGVEYLLVGGTLVIDAGKPQDTLPGKALKKCD